MANKYLVAGATYDGDGTGGGVVTFTTGTPGKVNFTGHGLVANQEVYFGISSGGAFPTGMSSGTKYFVRNPGTDDFEISTTSGGASIALSGTPSGTFHCSALATAAGGKGAWNNLGYFWNTNTTTATAPTYGTLSAGDIVYIRSKDASGANHLVNLTTAVGYVGSQVATQDAPIKWVFDNGEIWSNTDGTLEFDSSTNAAYYVIVRANNHSIAKTVGAIWVDYNFTDPNSQRIVSLAAGAYLRGWKTDNNEKTGSYSCPHFTHSSGILEDCVSIVGNAHYAGGVYQASTAAPALTVVINPTITINRQTVPGCVFNSAQSSNNGSTLMVIGGVIDGTAAANGNVYLAGLAGINGRVEVTGLNYPKQIGHFYDIFGSARYENAVVSVLGTDQGYGSVWASTPGYYDSRNVLNNYPVLNATMPDAAATKWSWRVVPSTYSGFGGGREPLKIPFAKVYAESSAAKKITLELQVSDTWTAASLTKSAIWMTVTYNKTDGTLVTETTRLPESVATLDTSTNPDWSSTSWGAVTLLKKKIELTTQNAIKQDTMVIVNLFWTVRGVSDDDMLIVCPDLQLSAAA